eukprot:2381213-Pleurochrysis_carterae.AAC.1
MQWIGIAFRHFASERTSSAITAFRAPALQAAKRRGRAGAALALRHRRTRPAPTPRTPSQRPTPAAARLQYRQY